MKICHKYLARVILHESRTKLPTLVCLVSSQGGSLRMVSPLLGMGALDRTGKCWWSLSLYRYMRLVVHIRNLVADLDGVVSRMEDSLDREIVLLPPTRLNSYARRLRK